MKAVLERMIPAGLLLLNMSLVTLSQKSNSIDTHSVYLTTMCSGQLSSQSTRIRDADLRCKNQTYVSSDCN